MGLFDRVAGLFSAKAAARHELAKVSALVAREVKRELVMRGYDAGRTTRATWSWMAGSTSANAEVYAGLISLRNRTRDLVRNNPHAAKAVRVITNNAVGTGIMATARGPKKSVNKKVDALWKEFISQCDFGGQMDFYGQQRLGLRAMLEGGGALVRLRPTAKGSDGRPLSVPLQLQLLETDYIDLRKNERLPNGNIIHQGVEFDPDGKRVAYWLFGEHPGETTFIIPQSYVSTRHPASEVLYLYEILRIGQIHGVPWLTPGVMKGRELDTYEEAELVRKRIEACVAAIVVGADDESQEGVAPRVVDGSGNKIEQFEPGLIAIARGAKDIKFTQPAATGGYSEYKRTQLQSLSAAWDVTYEQLSGDHSKTNFSALKAGKLEFERSIEVLQWLTVAPMLIIPVWRAFIDFGKLSGRLPDETTYDVELTMPKFESVDRGADTTADIDAVRALLMPPQEAIRRRGYDPDTVLADTKEWHEKLLAAKVVSDADAAQVGKAGSSNAKAPAPPAATETIVEQ